MGRSSNLKISKKIRSFCLKHTVWIILMGRHLLSPGIRYMVMEINVFKWIRHVSVTKKEGIGKYS